MEKVITTTTTRNLYTWMQIMGPEKRYVVLNAVKEHFRQKQGTRNNITTIGDNCKLHYYLTHDYKMLYILLGKVHWGCNDHHFPLCGCNCREGAIGNEDHNCIMISDDVQKKHWKLSVEHAAGIEHHCAREGTTITPCELKQEVYKRATEHNLGIAHYGCMPDEFSLSEVWPDFFHLDCVITKSLMTRLRNMVLGAGMEFHEGFHCRIKKFFNDYYFSQI